MELPIITEMVNKFMCPGCINGLSTKTCSSFELDANAISEQYGTGCKNHHPGTSIGLTFKLNLGLPKGFNHVSVLDKSFRSTSNIRLHSDSSTFHPDKLNMAVWAMEKDGYLFVRTYCPRIDVSYVDVIKDATLDLVPNVIDVNTFIEEID